MAWPRCRFLPRVLTLNCSVPPSSPLLTSAYHPGQTFWGCPDLQKVLPQTEEASLAPKLQCLGEGSCLSSWLLT